MATPAAELESPRAARTRQREAVLIAVTVAVANALLLIRVHNEAEDSIGYLVKIRDGPPSQIFNPYHLIHSWLGWMVYELAGLFGYDGGPLVPVQVLNAVIGAIGVGVLWLLMRDATKGRLAAVAATGIVALSYGYWAYSLGADVYALSAALLIVSLYAAYRAALQPSPIAFALFGAATGLTVLAHNTNALFAVVGAVAILLATRDLKLMLRYGVMYAAGVLVVVVPLYAVALASVDANTPSEANDWLTAYAQSGSWGNIEAQSAPKAVVGAGRALTGGHFAFALSDVRDLADRASGDQSLREETYLVRDYPRPLAAALFVFVASAGVAMLALAAQWLRRPALERRQRVLALLALAWLVPYTLFVAWWEPVNPEFWIAVWVPAAILLALPLSIPPVRWGSAIVGVLLVSLFAVNAAGSVAPQLTEDNDYWRERIGWYEAEASPDDLVITNGFIQSAYLRYFGRTQVLDIDEYADIPIERALFRIEERIGATDGGRVLISKEAFFPATDEYSECEEGVKPCLDLVAAVRERYEPEASIIYESPLETVWELGDR